MTSFNTMNSSSHTLTKEEAELKKKNFYEVKSEPDIEFENEPSTVFHSLRNLKNLEENNLNFSLKKEVTFFHANTKNSGSSASRSMMPNEANSRTKKLKQFFFFYDK